MKRTKRLMGLILMLGSSSMFAQLDEVGKMLTAGTADANKLVSAYLEPWGKGFAYGLSNGWYNTANTHGLLGFDITLTTTIASIPSAMKTYDLATKGLTVLSYSSPSTGPTIAGSKSDGPELTYTQKVTLPDNSQQDVSVKFKMPGGLNVPIVPTMALQAGIGLPKGTEIMGRYMPTLKIGDYGKLGMWGVGIKHDLKQWIPVVNKVPFWSMSFLLSYTSFKTSVSGEFLTPDPNQFYTSGLNMNVYKDQKVELSASALNASLLLSTNIPIFNVYAGLGLVSPSSKLKVSGAFPVPDTPKALDVQNSVSNNEPVKLGVKNIIDPINATLASKAAFKATVGFRLKLALLTIHGDYSVIDKYNLFSAGLGISFR
ncbi:MAG: hypothetical protein N2662_10350 [Bacteroidales bacterium]|nr:hypothetical protein [Bacteroidales bacterium]